MKLIYLLHILLLLIISGSLYEGVRYKDNIENFVPYRKIHRKLRLHTEKFTTGIQHQIRKFYF